MTKGITVVLYPVSDLASAEVLFTRLLGVEPMAAAGSLPCSRTPRAT
jgi:hypothetical protein